MRRACCTRIFARSSFGGASSPAISTVPATRNPSSIGVTPKARVLLLIGKAGMTSGSNSMAW